MSDTTRPPLAQAYDWKKTVWAALRRGGLTLLGLGVAAIVQALQDPSMVGKVLGEAPLAVALVPVVVGLASAFANWQKNKDR